MKLPAKFYIIVNTITYIVLFLSFFYLFIALLNQYSLWIDNEKYVALIIPLMGSIATVVLAVLTLQMVKEMRVAREEDRRPYVFVDFIFDSSVILLLVKNSGRSGAKNVTFKFSPEIVNTEVRNKISELSMFKNGIKFLPPSKEIKTWFDMAPQYYKSNLPKSFIVNISYSDVVSHKKYEEVFELDLNAYLGITTLGRKTIHNIAEELKKLHDILKGFGGSGFLVETKTQRDKRRKKQYEYLDEVKKEQAKKNKDSQ